MSTGAETREPLPPGFCCLGCGYDLASTRVREGEPCVECGRAVGPTDIQVGREHAALLARRAAIAWRAAWMWTLLIAASCGGLVVIGFWAAASAFLIVAGVVGWSVLMGLVASMPVAPHLRAVARATWLVHLWRLHFPWLWCGPVMGVVLLPIALVVGEGSAGEAGIGLFVLGVGASIWALSGWRVGIAPELEGVRLWRHTAGALSLIPSLVLALASLIVSSGVVSKLVGLLE